MKKGILVFVRSRRPSTDHMISCDYLRVLPYRLARAAILFMCAHKSPVRFSAVRMRNAILRNLLKCGPYQE